jgi:UDP:flavonoid glycosyltransferase YjiC (YdhE family)
LSTENASKLKAIANPHYFINNNYQTAKTYYWPLSSSSSRTYIDRHPQYKLNRNHINQAQQPRACYYYKTQHQPLLQQQQQEQLEEHLYLSHDDYEHESHETQDQRKQLLNTLYYYVIIIITRYLLDLRICGYIVIIYIQ